MLAHGAVTLQSQIFTGAELEAIARDYRRAGRAPAEGAMMAFAEKIAGSAYTVTAGDVESLRRHGFSDTEVLDIAFAAAARCFFSKVLDGVGAEPDRVFASLDENVRRALVVGRAFDATP
jgi:alkylhydroperoxidase family enzyme